MDTINIISTKKTSFFQWLRLAILVFAIIIFCGVLFIKINMPAAAKFTDHVLRPIFGATAIVFIEKIYFNTVDFIQKITFTANQGTSPFIDQTYEENLAETNLDFTPLTINKNLKPLDGEGVWINRPVAIFPNKKVLAYSFIRSDSERPFSTTTLLQIDMNTIAIGSVAGIKEPGSLVGKPGSGTIPKNVIDSDSLIAAFNGGFQYKDGAYGMIVNNTTYLPLKKNLGTFVYYQDGTSKIFDYQGESINENALFIRQNCPMLIQNSTIIPDTIEGKNLWNRFSAGTSQTLTWRSGLGMNHQGNLIFAVGNNLSPSTLASALKSAGAINAIQLDINQVWVRFNIFDSLGNGKYSSTPLNKHLHDGGEEYLKGYEKDFFYLYKK